jgi:hypothetical protein
MAGFNLPPGCSDRDIPGNRPEDIVAERIYDSIYDALEPLKLKDSEAFEQAVENIYKLINDSFNLGYQEAINNVDEARHWDEVAKSLEASGDIIIHE